MTHPTVRRIQTFILFLFLLFLPLSSLGFKEYLQYSWITGFVTYKPMGEIFQYPV
jgi:hypothetical protein